MDKDSHVVEVARDEMSESLTNWMTVEETALG